MGDPLTSTIPSVVYAKGMRKETAPVRTLIDEVLQIAQTEAEQSAVTIRQANIDRFVSREMSGYEEVVITLFSDTNRSKLVDFSSLLSDRIGSWRQRQRGTTKESFANQLAVEVLPLEFLDHVRS